MKRKRIVIIAIIIIIILLIIFFCACQPFGDLAEQFEVPRFEGEGENITRTPITGEVDPLELLPTPTYKPHEWTKVVHGDVYFCEICDSIYKDNTQETIVYKKDADKYGVRYFKEGYCSDIVTAKLGTAYYDIETGRLVSDNTSQRTVCKNLMWKLKLVEYFEVLGPRIVTVTGHRYVCINSADFLYSDVTSISVPPYKEERYGAGAGSSLEPTKYPYLGDPYTKQYHKKTCNTLDGQEYKVFLCDKDEAELFNFAPASDCSP